ncbi:MAG TPA: thiamine pyrophosphate-dependent dehydrogenase E1 component subunit alpha [Pseudonocardiaceae bacterium]|nr:thiamine pyrophosphate-dependent dehydrogenase E1 component subunit alpha [Pseudonocardiaceae bacterium]
MPTKVDANSIDQDQLLALYRTMRTIRVFEERVHVEFPTEAIPGAVHLYVGQEAIATGVCAVLDDADYIASTHRGHGHAIAKGCDVTAMMLEIYGRAGGLCGGKGGSMHIADFDRGMLGANGVAAGGVPLGCGAALSARVRGTDRVAVAFVGDGGANQGSFAESLTLAVVWRLPIIFVVEDNGYAQSTGTRFHLGGRDLAPRAQAVGIPARVIDGYDVLAVRAAATEAVDRARSGNGPTLLDCKAQRFFGHMEGWDQQAYRSAGEVDVLRAEHDPVRLFADRLIRERLAGSEQIAAVDLAVAARIDRAVEEARSAKDPDVDQVLTDVYVDY